MKSKPLNFDYSIFILHARILQSEFQLRVWSKAITTETQRFHRGTQSFSLRISVESLCLCGEVSTFLTLIRQLL
jgi:hypothetical protein